MVKQKLSVSDSLNYSNSMLNMLGRADQVVNHLYSRRLKKFGLTNNQYLVLRTIFNHPGLHQREIVVRSGIDRSTLGELLQRMERRRLVLRMYVAGNSKNKRCFATESALKILSEIGSLHLDVDKEIKMMIPSQYWCDFVQALHVLSNVHESGTKSGDFRITEL